MKVNYAATGDILTVVLRDVSAAESDVDKEGTGMRSGDPNE